MSGEKVETTIKEKKAKKKKIRCMHCKKNVGLLGFKCKCGKIFCSNHLMPECHNCNYNFKDEQICNLTTKLEKITADKVIKI